MDMAEAGDAAKVAATAVAACAATDMVEKTASDRPSCGGKTSDDIDSDVEVLADFAEEMERVPNESEFVISGARDKDFVWSGVLESVRAELDRVEEVVGFVEIDGLRMD